MGFGACSGYEARSVRGERDTGCSGPTLGELQSLATEHTRRRTVMTQKPVKPTEVTEDG
jgi:hypothetical protein